MLISRDTSIWVQLTSAIGRRYDLQNRRLQNVSLPMVQFTEGDDNVDDAFNRICDLGVVVNSSLFPCRPALFGGKEKRATATLER